MLPSLQRNPPTILFGNELATAKPVLVLREILNTHLRILGPPGMGKTRLLLWLFLTLCKDPDATVILFNFKGDLADMATKGVIAHGLTKRLVTFDLANPKCRIGYNPLRPNHLPIASHAKAVREAIRAAWGQDSFDQTPQLARLLFLSLAAVRELGLTLVDAVRLLRPRSITRREAMARLADPFLRELLAEFDGLLDARKEQLAASTVARLEGFVADPLIRGMLTQQQSLDLGEVIDRHKILIVNLEIGKPLALDDIRLLARMLVNDIVTRVAGRTGRRSPVYLLIDECQLSVTRDLARALELGRELALHAILAHQYPKQLLEEEPSGAVFNAVDICATNKIVFGQLPVEHAEPIAKECFYDDFNPKAVKDEIRHLELEPVESRRRIATRTKNGSRNWQDTLSLSSTVTRTRGSGRAWGEGEIEVNGSVHGVNSGAAQSMADTLTILPSGELVATTIDGAATMDSVFDAIQSSYGFTTTRSSNDFESESESEAEQTGNAEGGSRGWAIAVSEHPFYEYIKRRPVTSRTFWTFEEFLIRCTQVLHAMPKMIFVLKMGGRRAVFLRAPRMDAPVVRQSVREAALERVYAQPCYASAAQIEAAKREDVNRSGSMKIAVRAAMVGAGTHDGVRTSQPRMAAKAIPKPPTHSARS